MLVFPWDMYTKKNKEKRPCWKKTTYCAWHAPSTDRVNNMNPK